MNAALAGLVDAMAEQSDGGRWTRETLKAAVEWSRGVDERVDRLDRHLDAMEATLTAMMHPATRPLSKAPLRVVEGEGDQGEGDDVPAARRNLGSVKKVLRDEAGNIDSVVDLAVSVEQSHLLAKLLERIP